jgi:hypothetical protein
VDMKSSHAGEDGEVQGPDMHGDTEDAADKMRSVMDGDGGEVPQHSDEDGYGEDIDYGQ